ncbi:MAG: SARP family transcriptional regulator, partial [Armatimonadota bacterium]
MAELLWPDLEEKAQRNNLRQVLFRLRRVAGLLRGTDPLELGAAADVLEFIAALRAHRPPPGQGWLEGTLLGGFEYDDCPDLAEWL